MKTDSDYGYNGMDNCTKVCHFPNQIKSTEVEAVVNIVQVQPQKDGIDFDGTVF